MQMIFMLMLIRIIIDYEVRGKETWSVLSALCNSEEENMKENE